MSYTVCNVLDLGEAYTGATLNAQLYSSSNSTVGSAITTGFYERAGSKGIYTFTLTVPDGHQGWCDVYVQGASSNVLASLPLNPAELENADVKTSTRSTFAGGAVASVTGDVGGNVVGSIGSLATQAKADVNAEADTALADAGVTTTVTGRIDATISSRAPSSTALSTAQWTNGRASNLDNLDTTVSSRLATSGYTAPTTPPTVTAIRQEMDTNSTKLANLDAAITTRATPANVTSAQSAITSAISALNNLSQAQAQTAAAAALSAYGAATATNVSDTQTAITTAIGALNNLSATDAAAAIMAYVVSGGRDFQTILLDLWAKEAGNAIANDATNPTHAEYANPNGDVQIAHDMTATTRTVV